MAAIRVPDAKFFPWASSPAELYFEAEMEKRNKVKRIKLREFMPEAHKSWAALPSSEQLLFVRRYRALCEDKGVIPRDGFMQEASQLNSSKKRKAPATKAPVPPAKKSEAKAASWKITHIDMEEVNKENKEKMENKKVLHEVVQIIDSDDEEAPVEPLGAENKAFDTPVAVTPSADLSAPASGSFEECIAGASSPANVPQESKGPTAETATMTPKTTKADTQSLKGDAAVAAFEKELQEIAQKDGLEALVLIPVEADEEAWDYDEDAEPTDKMSLEEIRAAIVVAYLPKSSFKALDAAEKALRMVGMEEEDDFMSMRSGDPNLRLFLTIFILLNTIV